MSKKSITENYLYNLAYQLLAIIAPLVTTPYVSRVLGVANIGIYEYTVSITNYFILFGCLGLNIYGQREIAYHQDDMEYRSKIFWELFTLRTIMIFISIISFLISVVVFSKYSIYYMILIINIFSSIFDSSWLFQGMENFKVTVTRNFISKLLGILLIFVLVRSEADLWLYFMCQSLPLLLGNMSMWVRVSKLVGRPLISFTNSLRHLKPALEMFVPQIAISIYTLLDKSMLGLLTDNIAEVGYYGQAEKIIKLTLTIVTSMGIVMLPRIASHFANNDSKEIKYHINRSLKLVYFLAFPMIFGLIGISRGFVPWFFGEGYAKVAPLMNIISPIILLIGLSNVIGVQYLLPTKHQKEFTLSVIYGSAVNFILNLVLIIKFQAYGTSIATVCAELVVTVTQFYFVRREISFLESFKNGIRYFFAGIVMFTVVVLLGKVSHISVSSTLVQIVVGGGIYLGILFLIRDKFVSNIILVIFNKSVRGKKS